VGERFGKLPSEILAEDAELIQLLNIEDLGKGDDSNG
jgi:hypothetical protein